MEIKFAFPLLALASLLSGCATSDGSYPSLAIRDGERMTGTIEPAAAATTAVPATPGPVLDRLTHLASQARNAHSAFLAEDAKLRVTIRRRLEEEAGSDGWASGQVALAGLEASRNEALIALADLDRLYADAVTDGIESVKIEAVRNEVLALIQQEEAMLEAMTVGAI